MGLAPLFRGKPVEIPVDNHFAPPVVSDSRLADTERAGESGQSLTARVPREGEFLMVLGGIRGNK